MTARCWEKNSAYAMRFVGRLVFHMTEIAGRKTGLRSRILMPLSLKFMRVEIILRSSWPGQYISDDKKTETGPAQQDFDWGGLNVSQLFFFFFGGGGGGGGWK